MRTATLSMVCAVALGLAAGTAAAKDSPESVLNDAKALAKAGKGERLKAAERFGDAVALAQSQGNLAAEDAAATELEEFIDEVTGEEMRNPAAAGTTDAGPSTVKLLCALTGKLDPDRCGAFVSAPVLARLALVRATETGERPDIAQLAKVLVTHAEKMPGSHGAAVAAKYAEGMKSVADGKFDVAAPALDAVTADAAKSGWTVLASRAAVEAAAAWLKASAPEKAAASITAAAEAFGAKPDPVLVSEWTQIVARRLADAPAEVRKPAEDLQKRLTAGGGAGGAGASGGRGGKGGATDIGRLLPKLPKKKAIASATRSAKQFDIRWATNPDAKASAGFDEGIHYVDEGGVWLGFNGRSVALCMVDLVGGRGGLGGRVTASTVRAFYLVAEGETWSVSRDGIVTITR